MGGFWSRRRVVLALLAVLVLGALVWVAPGVFREAQQARALAGWVADQRLSRGELETMYNGPFSEAEVRVSAPHTVEYRYTYVGTFGNTQYAELLDDASMAMQPMFDDWTFPEMLDAGITEPKVRLTYLDPDGSTIWSGLFEPS